jgi:hypothetical protein
MTDMKCHQCPVKPPLACLGETTPSLCRRVAEGQPGRAEQLVALAEGPSLLEMAGGFLAAMRGLVADGGRLAPRAVRKARRAACLACPHHDPGLDACRQCGCGSVIPGGLVVKRAIASSECPDSPPRFGPV